jgi:hypothetical protein
MPPKRINEYRRLGRMAMSICKAFLVIGIILTVAGVLLGHGCWFFAVEAFVKIAPAAMLFAGTV